jgi:transposase-like protein
MVAAAYTDNELLAAWLSSNSVSEVARKLGGVDIRQLHRRRRKYEDKTGDVLPSLDPKRAPKQHLHPRARRFHLERPYTVVIYSDHHRWPEAFAPASVAERILLQVVADLQPDVILDNGDSLDGATISRHPPLGWQEMPSLAAELEAVKTFKRMLRKAAPKADCFWNVGNHDQRFVMKLASVASDFRGVKGFDLKHHFPAWEMSMSWIFNDVLVTKHRWHGGRHAAWNNVLKAGLSIVTGHTHRLKVEPHTDYTGTRYGVETGTLADPYGPQFEYTEQGPVAWQPGFIVATVDGDRLHFEPVEVRDGEAMFRGKAYRAAG